jgi:hypothetical protein
LQAIMTTVPSGALRRLLCAALGAAMAVIAAGGAAEAAWRFDSARFHASAHGQLACEDCHAAVSGQALHPDPARVARDTPGALDPQACTGCHASVREELERQRHGGQSIADPQRYADCRGCHDPHAAASAESRAGGYDPGRPVWGQCGVCHADEQSLPPVSGEDESCLGCHRLTATDDPQAAARDALLCGTCHGKTGTPQQAFTGRIVPLMDEGIERRTPHATTACTACHIRAAEYGHGRQQTRSCRACHAPHDESVAHDAHLSVGCAACHLEGGVPIRETAAQRVEWSPRRDLAAPLTAHTMVDFTDQTGCRRCHFSGNPLGAAAAVLPAKGILCLPCHAATLSVGNLASGISLVVVAGALVFGGLALIGARRRPAATPRVDRTAAFAGAGEHRHEYSGWPGALATALLDVFLQRRLYRRSVRRWLIHGLIFYPIALRAAWGVLALGASLWAPGWPPTAFLLDKNQPAAEFFFDATGVLLLGGVALSAWRGRRDAPRTAITGLPVRDIPALAGLAAIGVLGFVLEGLRMAMTGNGSAAAFVGYPLAAAVAGAPGLTDVYGVLWYAHAVAVAALAAYLPFSRLKHIILSPVVLTMNAFDRGHGTRQ